MLTPHFRTLDAAYQLHFYLIAKTHYLKPVLFDKHYGLIESVLADVCDREQYHLLEKSVTPDHLRLLLSLKPDQTVSRAVNMLKGNLSRQFGLQFPDDLAMHGLPASLGHRLSCKEHGQSKSRVGSKLCRDASQTSRLQRDLDRGPKLSQPVVQITSIPTKTLSLYPGLSRGFGYKSEASVI